MFYEQNELVEFDVRYVPTYTVYADILAEECEAEWAAVVAAYVAPRLSRLSDD